MRWALDRRAILKLGLAGAAWALTERVQGLRRARAAGSLAEARERRLGNLRQLTFGSAATANAQAPREINVFVADWVT